jgi:hypothetical protein
LAGHVIKTSPRRNCRFSRGAKSRIESAAGDAGAASGAASRDLQSQLPVISTHTIDVQGIKLFYREAGDRQAPAILLLHGFATSCFMSAT